MLLLTGNTVYMIITQELNEDTVYLLIQRLITCLAMSYFLKVVYNAREDLKEEQTPILDEDQPL